MLAPPNNTTTPAYPKRQITDEERHRLTAKLREVTTVKQVAKKTPDGYPIPGSAIIEYLPGWDDPALVVWINDQGPFFNGKGQKVPPLNVHAICAHRHRTVGRLFKKGPPSGKSKGMKKADLLMMLVELSGRVAALEERYTRPSDH